MKQQILKINPKSQQLSLISHFFNNGMNNFISCLIKKENFEKIEKIEKI